MMKILKGKPRGQSPNYEYVGLEAHTDHERVLLLHVNVQTDTQFMSKNHYIIGYYQAFLVVRTKYLELSSS